MINPPHRRYNLQEVIPSVVVLFLSLVHDLFFFRQRLCYPLNMFSMGLSPRISEKEPTSYISFRSSLPSDLRPCILCKPTKNPLGIRLGSPQSWFFVLAEPALSRAQIPTHIFRYHLLTWGQAVGDSSIMFESIPWVCRESGKCQLFFSTPSLHSHSLNLLNPAI